MAERFLKLIPSKETRSLAVKHPKAFVLLFFIADRARRENGDPDGLTIGQCHVGDWEEMGFSRQEYRTALNVLILKKFIEKVETCRTRQKSTTGSTTVGTLVRLLDSRTYDINPKEANHRINHCPTTGQPPANHEQEGRRISSSEDKEEIAQTEKRLRSKDVLFFDFESWQFVGISERDSVDWALMYPYIDLKIETLKATQWLKNNPSKSNKKNWRKYLTGWFGRSNDSIENKKAYKSAIGGSSGDRRTKDIEGNPVDNQHRGKF